MLHSCSLLLTYGTLGAAAATSGSGSARRAGRRGVADAAAWEVEPPRARPVPWPTRAGCRVCWCAAVPSPIPASTAAVQTYDAAGASVTASVPGTAWRDVLTWLRPITASLDAPGEVLETVLEGHADAVSAICALPDGRLASCPPLWLACLDTCCSPCCAERAAAHHRNGDFTVLFSH